MMIKLKYRITKAIANVALAVMILLIANNVVFLHTHILRDGTIIMHAHPFCCPENSNSSQTHHHSNSSYLFYDVLNLLFFIALFRFSFYSRLEKAIEITPIGLLKIFNPEQIKGRSPPLRLSF